MKLRKKLNVSMMMTHSVAYVSESRMTAVSMVPAALLGTFRFFCENSINVFKSQPVRT